MARLFVCVGTGTALSGQLIQEVLTGLIFLLPTCPLLVPGRLSGSPELLCLALKWVS